MKALRSLEDARAALDAGEADPASLVALAARRNRELDAGRRPVRAFLATLEDGPEPPVPAARSRGGGGRGAEGPLAGVPVAVKDNLCTTDFPTTCGSRILEGYRPPYDATVVRRIRDAGAVVFGKTNLDEFAMGSSTETGAFGPTRNPIDRSRVAGGSSGGSAAAVAAGIVPVALGTDTGGSVRQPAAFCGVVGVKPTYGRVSRYGLVAFASSLDQAGVLARCVRDAAVVLEVISGLDPRDATSRDLPAPRASELRPELAGRVLGVPREHLGDGLDDRVRDLTERAVERARGAGARVREVSLPSASAAIPCYYVLAPAEASSNLARHDGVRYGRRAPSSDVAGLYATSRAEGLGREVKRRILIGTYVLSAGYFEAYYRRAQRLRQRIAREMAAVFETGVDAIFSPTTPTPAFGLGEKSGDPYAMYLADVYTVSANLAGLPAVSLPIGNADGLPVGGQLVCPAFQEERMLGIAAGLERALANERPPVAEGGTRA